MARTTAMRRAAAKARRGARLVFALAVFAALGGAARAQQSPSAAPVVLDHVAAVVNNQAILASEIDDEMRLEVLEPNSGGLTPRLALEELIGRALIEQQIREENAQIAEPSASEIETRLQEIRSRLPACVRANCASAEGWKSFLAAHGLTEARVEAYLKYRMQILSFIEQRFRQGILIGDGEIESYYREQLLPQYRAGDTAPPLQDVSKRIEEILLQQQVNALFDDWLNRLRKEGEVEVTDPAYETPAGEETRPKANP